MMKRMVLLCVAVMTLTGVVFAKVTLPHVFSDHMVLQQQKPIPVWGKADAGETVTVTFAGQKKKTVADAAGHWMVTLHALKATAQESGQTMTITGKNEVVFKDVLVGEVWVCSGQSNMQFALSGANNAQQEVAAAKYPLIRLYTVPDVTAQTPQDDCGGRWLPCSPETAAGFTAVGYFFGRYLHQQLKVPIGLIHTSWGGTVAEAWTSASALRAKLPNTFDSMLDTMSKLDVTKQDALMTYQQKSAARQAAIDKMYDQEEDIKSATAIAATDLDDSAWKTMALPAEWKSHGLADVDGIVWFRKTIDVPAAWAGKEIILRPGPIDEVDNTWFNGVWVGGKGRSRTGETSYWNAPREYRVPGTLVKAGKNVIAIRVSNLVGEAGLWGAPADTLYVELADGTDQTRIPLAGDWRYFTELVLPVVTPNPIDPNLPSVLFNAMINPLIPYSIRGVIWYQGEQNADRAKQYQTLLPTMITDWRTRWQEGNFPFLIVQLANYMARSDKPIERGWAELREAQAMTAAKLPKVGLALAIDIGVAGDIHPHNKQDVGLRLGLAARAIAYNDKHVAYSGPVFNSVKWQNGKAELTFQHTDGGLLAHGDLLKGFAIRDKGKDFVWAQAKIVGDKVVVWADGVTNPDAVRYGWANNPDCNLYNGAGLPTVPFRTDSE